MSIVSYYGTGRRKSSSARVFLRTPTESAPVGIFVNGKTLEQYFVRDSLKLIILQPLELTGLASTFHVRVTVKGGGLAGQAGAIRLGISRALYYWAAKSTMRFVLTFLETSLIKWKNMVQVSLQIFLKMNLNFQKSL